MEALCQALKEAGLPDDPGQVVGRIFGFGADEIIHREWVGEFPDHWVEASSVQIAGIVTGIELYEGKLLRLFPAKVQIGGAVVEHFDWKNRRGWRALIEWGETEGHGHVFGRLQLLGRHAVAAAR